MVSAVKTKENKRKSTRHDCAVPVEGKLGSAFAESQTIDISRGGAGLILRNPVAVNTRMAIELDLSPQEEPVLAIGEVRWVSRIASSNLYRIGISFAEPESRLNKYFK